MSKIDANELVDIFKEEVTKKAKKDVKKQLKKEKQLEKKENLEFQKLAKKQEKLETKKEKEKNQLKNETEKKVVLEKEQGVFSFLYDTLFGFFLILLCLCTSGFIIFSIMEKQSLKNIIQVSLIGIFACFYVLSMTLKKEGLKKIAAIISSIAICLFMAYLFYMA